jgi:hypothetical protein
MIRMNDVIYRVFDINRFNLPGLLLQGVAVYVAMRKLLVGKVHWRTEGVRGVQPHPPEIPKFCQS